MPSPSPALASRCHYWPGCRHATCSSRGRSAAAAYPSPCRPVPPAGCRCRLASMPVSCCREGASRPSCSWACSKGTGLASRQALLQCGCLATASASPRLSKGGGCGAEQPGVSNGTCAAAAPAALGAQLSERPAQPVTASSSVLLPAPSPAAVLSLLRLLMLLSVVQLLLPLLLLVCSLLLPLVAVAASPPEAAPVHPRARSTATSCCGIRHLSPCSAARARNALSRVTSTTCRKKGGAGGNFRCPPGSTLA